MIISQEENGINNQNNENNQNQNQIKDNENFNKEGIPLTKKREPKADEEHIVDIREPKIWSGFPFCERFFYSLCCKTRCCSDYRNGEFLSNDCIKNPCSKDQFVNLNNKILSISIIKSGTLEIKELILHPFVRVSFINLKTGKFLQKSNFNEPSVNKTEESLIIKHIKGQNRLDFESSILDFIPPFSTCPFDLREKGEAFAEWNETFYINESADYLLNSNNIMFFELMDFSLDYDENPIEPGIIPMAWGYLKMVGFSRTYLGKYKIQLYNYKFNRPPELNRLKNMILDMLQLLIIYMNLIGLKKVNIKLFLKYLLV